MFVTKEKRYRVFPKKIYFAKVRNDAYYILLSFECIHINLLRERHPRDCVIKNDASRLKRIVSNVNVTLEI